MLQLYVLLLWKGLEYRYVACSNQQHWDFKNLKGAHTVKRKLLTVHL
jgi:hypothetical protein